MQHPGNIAVDDFNGGRLIFYDFGMMGRCNFPLIRVFLFNFFTNLAKLLLFAVLHLCSISPNIREGLLEVFYGVYEKDPEKVSLNCPICQL